MSRTRFSKKWRAVIAKRANYRCEYCKTLKAYAPSPFDIKHIKALSLGGLSILKNLAYSCHGCNLCKSNKIEAIDPVENILVPLFHPRKFKWSEHFQWSDDELEVIGLTATGRATIDALQLNRVELINLRSLLKIIGEHPPKED